MIDHAVKARIQEEGERFITLLDRYKDKLPNSLYVGLRGTMQVYIEPGGMERAERIDEEQGQGGAPAKLKLVK